METVRLLIDAGADVQGKDRYGHNALAYAEKGGHDGIAELLMECQRSVFRVINGKSLEQVRQHYQLLHEKYPRFWQSSKGQVYIDRALCNHVGEGHLSIVRYMIEDLQVKADIRIEGEGIDCSPLTLAIRMGNEEMALHLIHQREDFFLLKRRISVRQSSKIWPFWSSIW